MGIQEITWWHDLENTLWHLGLLQK